MDYVEDIKFLLAMFYGYIEDELGGVDDKDSKPAKEFKDLMNKYELTMNDLGKYFDY